ncbi:MAG: nickel pincer cofactor biosynthesis protein LarC [Deltaproteobacteria bacterium]|nr:nickel pincer cofactor biosynthesis protein LarC [Deltaproteobacteria bacterium]
MKIAYLDCFSGISGDMLLGALLDAGLPFEDLRKALHSLPLDGYRLDVRREERNHLSGTRFTVEVDKALQVGRGLEDIRKIILAGGFSPEVKDRSIRIFESIAREEARIHNCPVEEIHFHEVGAVDSIVDIVGSVFGMEFMGVRQLHASALPLGAGFVETAHGRIPVPAPATVALLKGIPVYGSGLNQEMVTPTGAALLRDLADSFGDLPPMVVEAVGYGVGSRNLADRPNLLRLLLGRAPSQEHLETVVVLEANLDDTTPEWLGFMMERLLQAGALDVSFSPVQMKKNRPGTAVQVLGRPEHKDRIMEILFSESTTLGVRFRFSERKVLERSSEEIDSPWGRLRVKRVRGSDGSSMVLPEYEACRGIAQTHRVPLREVYYWVMSSNRDRHHEESG